MALAFSDLSFYLSPPRLLNSPANSEITEYIREPAYTRVYLCMYVYDVLTPVKYRRVHDGGGGGGNCWCIDDPSNRKSPLKQNFIMISPENGWSKLPRFAFPAHTTKTITPIQEYQRRFRREINILNMYF